MLQNLDVLLWEQKVGTLLAYKEKYAEKICFYFDSTFLSKGYDIAPLRASINSVALQKGMPIYADDGKIFGGLPSFIADSLPDHWGNTVFNEWAKTQKISSRHLSALDRLAYIGNRGMGALEFHPSAAKDMEQAFKVEIDGLYNLACQTLNEAKSFRAELQPNIMIESLFKVGTSAGGRRPKAIINYNPDTHECYSGQVPTPLPGFIPMIIKFDEHSDIPTTRIEYSYYLMAKAAGLHIMPSSLLEGKDAVHFLTERFDRRNGKKIHTQTLAAIRPAANSYEDLFDTAYRIGIIPAEIKQMFLQTVLNVAGGNVDDHNKNFSFLMNDDGIWHIAPAYDFTFAIDCSAQGYMNRHCMTINNKNSDIDRQDLLTLAKQYNIKGADAIIDNVIETVSNYGHYSSIAGIEDTWRIRIEDEIQSRAALLKK